MDRRRRQDFEDRALCIDKQYSGYAPVDDVHLNGKLTLGENTADNGGLRPAWMALMEKMKTEALGDVDGFSPEQRFFIGWAQMWCENRADEVSRLPCQDRPAFTRKVPGERGRLEHA